MEKHPIESLMGTSMESIREMVDVNTVVGDPVQTQDGSTIIPISKVSFGFGAGGSEFAQGGKDTDNNGDNTMFGGGAGSGVSINPIAFLVVGKDQVRILPITNNVSTADRIIDSVPDILNKIKGFVKDFTSKNDSSKEENVQNKEEEQE